MTEPAGAAPASQSVTVSTPPPAKTLGSVEPEDTGGQDTGGQGGAVTAGPAAAWSNGVSAVGELVGSVDVDGLHVDLLLASAQAATADAQMTSGLTAWHEGDPLVYLNVVVTNMSSSDIEMANQLMTVDVAPQGWPYSTIPYEPALYPYTDLGLIRDPADVIQDTYTLGPGESFSLARTVPASEVTAPVAVTASWRSPDYVTVHEASTTVQLG